MVSIKIDLRGMAQAKQVTRGIKAEIAKGPKGMLRPAFLKAKLFYLAFIRRRFLNAARGDGTWPDLAVSTKWGRMRKKLRGYKTRLEAARKGRPLARGDTASKLEKKVRSENRRLERLLSLQKGSSRRERIAKLVAGQRFEILRDTGTLFNSLTEGAEGNVTRETRAGITVGTSIIYGKYHQLGGKRGRPPKREFLVAPDRKTFQQIADAFAQAVKDMVRRLGGSGGKRG